MEMGYLNLVLHAHLPFVRHVDRDDRLEERWLFSALTESYIPLLQAFGRLVAEQVDFQLTFSLSPTLISMLADDLLQTRYRRHLQTLLTLSLAELERTKATAEFHRTALTYRERLLSIADFFDRCDGNILTAFADLHRSGNVELITSSATHAFLPYVQTEEALNSQIATAVAVFSTHFGHRPNGLWLPECAYAPHLDAILRTYDISYVFVDAHALKTAGCDDTSMPVRTAGGLVAFARDERCSEQVWSTGTGYPGDYDYREYYRDIGYDLDDNYIRPFIHPEGIRVDTGFKYYRITGSAADKQPYDIDQARNKAIQHGEHFVAERLRQVEEIRGGTGAVPIITAPYDAELFGHWWYEGPDFLEAMLRSLNNNQTVSTITPSAYLNLQPALQTRALSFSTWGRAGYGDVWLNEMNDWVYPSLHACEERMRQLANQYATACNDKDITQRALTQMARELMLAQSSDWAFILDARTATDYAAWRAKLHVETFEHIADMLEAGEIDDAWLTEIVSADNLFPDLDVRIFQSREAGTACESSKTARRRVLMLSWEYPPMSVGGLARHVCDLSRYMVKRGDEVHVITLAPPGVPLDEVVDGVHVHRVSVLQPDGGAFIHFVLGLNLQLLRRGRQLREEIDEPFDVIHAHDWLVAQAAKMLKAETGLPLVATIHATEHGRNHGIYTDTHRHIHGEEQVLARVANHVIVCSTYMQDEVMTLFELPVQQVSIIPNGVDAAMLSSASSTSSTADSILPQSGPVVLYVGRLVREKGVHVLLDAAPDILAAIPDAQFVIVGTGPMMDPLKDQAARLGVDHHVHFTGYADDALRNHLLHTAAATVFPSLYEPFGIVALEAMAAGTPVVVSDVGGLADIVQHEHTGLKAYPEDPRSIATQVTRILLDRDLANKLSQNANTELRRFDWNTIAAETSTIYDKLSLSME